MQNNTIQYNTIQYNTIQYNTMQYNTIQNLFIFLTHATYTMKPNTMQLMQHSTQKGINAMPHDTQPMPPIPPMQFYG